MKSILFISAILLFPFFVHAKAIVCSGSIPNNCIEITKFSNNCGTLWFEACWQYESLQNGTTWTYDCPAKPIYTTEKILFEGLSDQYTHSRSIDGKLVNTVYKLESNKLCVDGVIICEFAEHINAVIFALKTGETVALKQKNCQVTAFTIDFHVPIIFKMQVPTLNIPAIEKDIMKAAISVSPNPINFSKESLLIQSSIEIVNIELIDMYGRVYLLENEKWKGSKSINISVNPGIYILRMKAINTQTYFDQKIVVIH